MLTVEQRHALITCFEEARRQARTFERLHVEPGEARIDAAVRIHIQDEAIKHDFYELVNSLTNWGTHPAAREVAP